MAIENLNLVKIAPLQLGKKFGLIYGDR